MTIKTISEQLPTEVNEKTGSTFFVVADSPEVQGALRLWFDGSNMGKSILMFRYRLSPKIEVLNFPYFLGQKWPAAQFTTIASNYASVAGAIHFKNAASVSDAVELAKENDLAPKIRELIEGMFPGLSIPLSAEDFNLFIHEQIAQAFELSVPKKKGVILSFGTQVSHLEGGVEIHSADLGVHPTPTPNSV